MDDNKELVRRIAATFAGYHPHKDGWEAYIDEAEDVLSIIQPELDKRDAKIIMWLEKLSTLPMSHEASLYISELLDMVNALKTTTGHDNNGGGV